jgi:hypothetical protein
LVSVPYAYKADTANVALAAGGTGFDNDWVRATPADSVLYTIRRLGIARGGSGNHLYGNLTQTHVNLGVGSTTGASSQNYDYCTVGGGQWNVASGRVTTVGGGSNNIASGSDAATVSGGVGNLASGPGAFVGGGGNNAATNSEATVAGGYLDTAYGVQATIGGGYHNRAVADYSTIAGGSVNSVSGQAGAIVGGHDNTIYSTSHNSFIGGGFDNITADSAATCGGGAHHRLTGKYATVGGGCSNSTGYLCATVGGGDSNAAAGYAATVAGGRKNAAAGVKATVAGGQANSASGEVSTVGGGNVGYASGFAATVGGGDFNTASGDYATVAGGFWDRAEANYSFAVGNSSHAVNVNSATFTGSTTTADNQVRAQAFSTGTGVFTSDHPLDPNGKLLNQYAMGSSELVMFYRGAATIGSDGRVQVQLPDYFDAYTRNSMVQLTGVGTYEVFVAENVSSNHFVIGGKPGTQVFWTVTGERKDVQAEIARILTPVEQPKTGVLREVMVDDDALVGCMQTLEQMGKAGEFSFRTAAGRQRYEDMLKHLRDAKLPKQQ